MRREMEGLNQGSPETTTIKKKQKKTSTITEEGARGIGELGIEKKSKKKTPKAGGNVHIDELRTEELGKTRALDNDMKGKKKKKTKKNDAGIGQDSVHPDDGKNSVHLSDEDDMLFNFNIQPEDATFDDKIFLGTSRTKVRQDSVHPDDGKNFVHLSDEDDMLFNSEVATFDDKIFLGTSHTKVRKTELVLVEEEKAASMMPSQNNHELVGSGEISTTRKKEKKKKRKVDEEEEEVLHLHDTGANGCLQQSKKLEYEPSSVKQHFNEAKKMGTQEVLGTQINKGRRVLTMRPTFSMAVAGSIVDNAQSLELATMLAGQIARAAAIFRVDEIVVFDDYDGGNAPNLMQEDSVEEVGGLFMVRILNYLEMPQYLRRALLPMHRSLNSVGKLPPLDAPHHLRKHEWRPFREGVVLDKRPLSGSGCCVDVGLEKEVLVGQSLTPGMRVTVAMGQSKSDGGVLQVVDREAARQAGFYWGYTVRYANCLSAVFDECPFEGKYDYCIGTSEHGEKIRSTDLVIPKSKHLLVAFGGLSGLEESLELDKKLKS